MNFDDFWKDERIPKRMKRCGPAPVRQALAKRPDKDGLEERILASLPGYERHKADYADYCMLSTYINQERDKVEWDEMEEHDTGKRDWWEARADEQRIKERLRVVK